MRRILSIFMVSLTICAIGGIAWVQNKQVEAKEEFEEHLMIRYGKPFKVEVYYDREIGRFAGEFKDNTTKKSDSYHIEPYSDGTFYDDLLEKTWANAYEEKLKKEWESKELPVEDIQATIPRGTDTLLYGEKIVWDGDVGLEDALKEGLEKRISLTLDVQKKVSSTDKERIEKEIETLSEKVKGVKSL